MVSIIIASRVDEFLQRTIDDLMAKAEGEVEVIVVLDGYWPDPMLAEDPRVVIIHQGIIHDNVGMRGGINAGVDVARGDYIMKIDEHCMVDQGYDVKLAADCKDNWVVIPRRYRLDAHNWAVIEDGRPPIDYMYLAYPFTGSDDAPRNLHGLIWNDRYHKRKDILLDDTMSWQGSCWFMKRKYWQDLIGPLDDKNYGSFIQEAQEIGNKVWLSGGRLVVNKKTWYAHYHKRKEDKGLGFSNHQQRVHMAGKEKGRQYSIDFWFNNKWGKRVHDFEWLIEKFWPVPTWPDNWPEVYKKRKVGQKI